MQNQSKILGVRPYPLRSESFSGYLLRLCDLNGIERISQLLIAAGVNKPKTTGYTNWSETHFNDALKALSMVLDRDKHKILDCSDLASTVSKELVSNCEDAPLHCQSRYIQRLNARFLRICPTCIAETSVINSAWQYITVARCPDHKTKLIDCCPECNEPLKWQASIFEKCNKCGFQWSDFKGDEYASFALTDIEKALMPNELGVIANNDELVDAICKLLVSMARPFDLFIESFECMPTIQHYSDLLLRTIDCYVNATSYDDWLLLRKEQLNPIIINSGADVVKKLKTQSNGKIETNFTFALPVSHVPIEYIEFVKAKWRKIINDGNVTVLRNYIKAPQLAYSLGLKTQDFHCLIELIKPANGTPIKRDRLYCITETHNFIANLAFSVHYQDKVTINAGSKILRVFICNYGVVLKAVLEGAIAGELVNKSNLSEVFVEYSSLLMFLKDELAELLKSPVSVSKVAFSLGCGPNKVTELVGLGKLESAPWRHAKQISGTSLLTYWHKIYSESILRDMCFYNNE